MPNELEEKKPNIQGAEQETQASFWSSIGTFVWDFLKIFLIALAIIIPVRYYLFQPFIVTGQSMVPNFLDGQYLIIDEISPRFADYERGEVVVIHSPQDPGQFFIKRLIGLPGETVQISGGRVTIKNSEHSSGFTLEEDYLPDGVTTFGNMQITLGPEEVFVLGDNRVASSDSRVFGPIKRSSIVGKVFFRAFPLDKVGLFNTPEYNF